jgi:two-component system cell cycle response regulator
MKVLIVEDDQSYGDMLRTVLGGWGYEAVLAADGGTALELLRADDSPRLVLLDWMIPAPDGVEVCRSIRRHVDGPYRYVLLTTAKAGRDEVLAGLEAGADDYLIKPVDLDELRARLRTGRRVLELQDRLLSTQAALWRQATHDALTGLWNRAAVLDAAERELARGRRAGAATGLLLADLDHFKRVNDTLGHAAGDAVLQEAARRLGAPLRPYDLLGRYGGEEFVVVLPGCDLAQAAEVAERLREHVAGQPVSLPEGPVELTVSLGAAAADPARGEDLATLLQAVDAALYRAKRGGRNRVECAPTPAAAAAAPAPLAEAVLKTAD